MEGRMKVAVMTDVMKIEMTERDIPKPKEDEVLVKIEYVGVCGSDLHYYENGGIGANIVKPPFVLGHEAGGTVVEVGSSVTHLKVGDRVALEPGKTCGHCEFCKTGRYNLCPDVIFFATPPVDGVFQEYVAHEADLCFKIPDNMDTMEGALIEPLSVGFHATELSDARLGESAIVLGCGCIGLCTIMCLKARGVQEIYVADVMQKRLDKALEVGATRVFNSQTEDIVAFAKSLPGGGVDLVYECAGNRITTLQTARCLKKGGKITLVGVSPEPVLELDTATLNDVEGTVYSVYRYRNTWPKAIAAVASGDIPLKKIVSHVFDFKDCIEAIDYSLKHKDEVIKAVIKMPD